MFCEKELQQQSEMAKVSLNKIDNESNEIDLRELGDMTMPMPLVIDIDEILNNDVKILRQVLALL